MPAYILRACKKGGNYFMPGPTLNTEEYVRNTYDLSLGDRVIEDRDGALVHRYRLFSRNCMKFTDTLEYDIGCPHCGSTLRLCDIPVDTNTHGLYKCRACDKGRSR